MIVNDLQRKMIEAMKSKDETRLSVIRYLNSAIKNKEIELRPLKQDMTDEVVLSVIKKQIKNRNQAIEQFKAGNREDLVAKESAELAILSELQSEFAPAQ